MILRGTVTKTTQDLMLIATVLTVVGFLGMSSVALAAGDRWTKKRICQII